MMKPKEEKKISSTARNIGFGAIFLLALIFSYECLHAENNNKVNDVQVKLDKTINVEFPPLLRSSGVEYLQFSQMEWSSELKTIAASVRQGAYLFFLNVDTGKSTHIRTGEVGANLMISWLPQSHFVVATGFHTIYKPLPSNPSKSFPFSQNDWRIIDVLNLQNKQIQLNPDGQEKGVKSFKGLDGGSEFLAVMYRGRSSSGVDVTNELVRYRGNNWQEVGRKELFPADGTNYYPRGIDMVSIDGEIIVAVYAFHVIRSGESKVGLPDVTPITENILHLVNGRSGKLLCAIDVFEGDPSDAWRNSQALFEGVALSSDGKYVGINTSKVFDIYDAKTCKLAQRLMGKEVRDRSNGGTSIKFSGDGRYLIAAGADVNVPKGGILNVWRVADGKQVFHLDLREPNAIAAEPGGHRFAIGHDKGDISLFSINEK